MISSVFCVIGIKYKKIKNFCDLFYSLCVILTGGKNVGVFNRRQPTDIEAVYDRNADMMYRIAISQMQNNEDAQDAVQDVFAIYLSVRPTFTDAEHEKAWFIRVTINCSKTLFQFLKRITHEEFDEDVPEEEDPEEFMEEFLEQLSPDYRTVIHLFYYEDLTTMEISKVLNKKESTVRMQLTRARRMLKDIMEEAKENV